MQSAQGMPSSGVVPKDVKLIPTIFPTLLYMSAVFDLCLTSFVVLGHDPI